MGFLTSAHPTIMPNSVCIVSLLAAIFEYSELPLSYAFYPFLLYLYVTYPQAIQSYTQWLLDISVCQSNQNIFFYYYNCMLLIKK